MLPRNKCIVRHCRVIHDSSSDKENGITLFTVPKNCVERWQEAIPYLNKSSYVCSRHFDESDIVKGREILNVFHPYLRWKLKTGSYPKHMLLHSDYPQELGRKQTAKQLVATSETVASNEQVQLPVLVPTSIQKSPNHVQENQDIFFDAEVDVATSVTIETTEQDQEHEGSVEASLTYGETLSSIVIPVCDKQSLNSWSSFVKLPSTFWEWSFNRKLETVFCTNYAKSEQFNAIIVKTVAVRLSGELNFLYNGNNTSHCDLPSTFSNFENLSGAIELFDKLKPCEGIYIPLSKLIKYSNEFAALKDRNGNWRSRNCAYVFDKKYAPTSCTSCRALKAYLLQKIERLKLKKLKEMNEKCEKLRRNQQLKRNERKTY